MNIYDMLLSRCICSGDKDDRIDLNVTENGIYESPPGKVFNRVLVNTPYGGEAMIIELDSQNKLTKTFAEIFNYLKNGTPCYLKYGIDPSEGSTIDDTYVTHRRLLPIVYAYKYNTDYRVYAIDVAPTYFSGPDQILGAPGIFVFSASNSNDYPEFLKYVSVLSTSCQYNHGFPV